MTEHSSGTFARPYLGKVEVVYRDDNFAIGSLGEYLLTTFRHEVLPSNGLIWARALNELQQAYPDRKLGLLSYLEPTCAGPVRQEALSIFIEGVQRSAPTLGGVALAFEGQGFSSATFRSQLMLVINASKSTIPYGFFPQLEQAAGWLTHHLRDKTPLRNAGLCRALEELQHGPEQSLSVRAHS